MVEQGSAPVLGLLDAQLVWRHCASIARIARAQWWRALGHAIALRTMQWTGHCAPIAQGPLTCPSLRALSAIAHPMAQGSKFGRAGGHRTRAVAWDRPIGERFRAGQDIELGACDALGRRHSARGGRTWLQFEAATS
jgi:hypothetical protein